jgi:hypothetical protein
VPQQKHGLRTRRARRIVVVKERDDPDVREKLGQRRRQVPLLVREGIETVGLLSRPREVCGRRVTR